MRTVDIEKWRGRRDTEALDPQAIQFRAEPRKGCAGCLFDHQWSGVCRQAGEVAARAGIPDCAQGFIYVAAEVDPRQVDFLRDGQPDECESSSGLAKSRGMKIG
jgi:hypothetical protein